MRLAPLAVSAFRKRQTSHRRATSGILLGAPRQETLLQSKLRGVGVDREIDSRLTFTSSADAKFSCLDFSI
jgi:hypothetical protein